MVLIKAAGEGDLTGTPTVRHRAIRRASLHEQVVERLRRLIALGDIAAGGRVNEVALAEAFGVSRTPMREAIKLLASEGVLELLPGKGARVRRFDPAEILDVFEVIGALERHAVERLTASGPPKGLAEIRRLLDRMESDFITRDRRSYFQANQRMHALFIELSASPTLIDTHTALAKKVRHDRHATLLSDQRWSDSMAEHRALFDAILSGDADRAGRLMLEHSRRTGAAIAAIASSGAETGQ